MGTRINVLIAEDCEGDAVLLARQLSRGGYEPFCKRVDTALDMAKALAEQSWDIVFSDNSMPRFSAAEALALLKEYGKDIPFIIVSGTITDEKAADAMKMGAQDYLVKGNLARLVPAVERELREAEIRRTNRKTKEDLISAREELIQAQKMETIGRLAGGIAHDFNNLLTTILSQSESLLDVVADDSVRRQAAEIHDAAGRGASLTRQLLAFSRRQSVPTHLFDLNAVVSGLELILRKLIGNDVELTLVLARDPAKIRGNLSQMEQVLMNLVINASDAMPKGGKIKIETGNVALKEEQTCRLEGLAPGDFVFMTVADTGSGMDAETLSKVFEPFFTTKESGKGVGLGLSTVSRIVRQAGGAVDVASEVGSGTTFKIYLPRHHE